MIRFAWLIVVGIALALSNWSLAFVAARWGVQPGLAWIVSAGYDGVALICASLALQAARRGDSAMAPTAALLLFGGLSAWLNSAHAAMVGDPIAARVMFATPPIAALLVTELQLRADRRDALRAAGRIADPLPAFGGAIWLNLPVRTYRAERRIMRHRLTEKCALATWSPLAALAIAQSKAQCVRIAASAVGADQADIVAWLAQHEAHIPAAVRPVLAGNVRDTLREDGARGALVALAGHGRDATAGHGRDGT